MLSRTLPGTVSECRWNPVVNAGHLVFSSEENTQAFVDPYDPGYATAPLVRCSDPLLLRKQDCHVPQSVAVRTEFTTYCRVESREMGKSLGPRALWRTLWCVLTAGFGHSRAELTGERMEKGDGLCAMPSSSLKLDGRVGPGPDPGHIL